ncbi:Glutathione transport system permease protein gsiC OS=Afipia felis OX=1035 GN=gsiC_2 PE=3 SV=1 [Afipia felis]
MNKFKRVVAYFLRRLAQAIPIILAIVVVNFLLLRLAPGNMADVLAGESGSATPEFVDALRERFGLNQPLYVQLFLYIKNVLMFDLGYSFRNSMPVAELIMQRLGPTLLLMCTTFVISIGLGSLLGVISASRVHGWRDSIISLLAIVAYATPLFWIGLMLILLFSIHLGWFPASGMETVAAFNEGWDRVKDIAWHLVLPAVTLSLFYMATYTRLMRSTVIDQYGMDYVLTAYAKGLNERQIMMRHVIRNAILPIITLAGIQVGALLGGSVVVESVFGWPGLGLLAYEALFARDYNLLLGIFFFSACLVVVINLFVDILYTFIDPRIELR